MKIYKIISWDTREVLAELVTLSIAKKHCRKLGHTGEHNGKYYSPIAYVEDSEGLLVYNPRFKVK